MACAVILLASSSRGDSVAKPISYDKALALATERGPQVAVALSQETVAGSEIGIAGVYPNPTVIGGTNSQTAAVAVTLSVPLTILGQRGAAIRAAQIELDATRADTEVVRADVRAGAAHAFVALWVAEGTASARSSALKIIERIDDAVGVRVQYGATPELEGVRTQAQRLRAQADAREAEQLVAAAAADLGRWIGIADTSDLRTEGEPRVPVNPPAVAGLVEQVEANPAVARERAQARSARARAERERALVRPAMTLELGVDAMDPTLPATNYRAQLGVELPIFNQRGPYVQREERTAATALLRASYEASSRRADLMVAYRTFEAFTSRATALAQSVLPAAERASSTTQDSYSLGRASLEAVLDAERLRIDTELILLEARAGCANAWIDVERALGTR
jgi:cobalt-zinc-cadmium efflux system outer membrane protein